MNPPGALAPARVDASLDIVDAIDLTRVNDERNVNPFVSGDQSPQPTFGLRPAWICFALVALRAPA
jgi:hypothetical protein